MFIPDDLYACIEASIPIVCVDFVLVRRADDRVVQVGLIQRTSPYGLVWCHLGGRVKRGETIAQAIRRHLGDSLHGAHIDIGPDPQPVHTYQWFPSLIAPDDDLVFGSDERKHAIGLSFVIEEAGDPRAGNGEALDFRYFAPDALPETLWPGCRGLFEKLLTHPGDLTTVATRRRAGGTTRPSSEGRPRARSAKSSQRSPAC